MVTEKKLRLPEPEKALPGRSLPMPIPAGHYVNGNSMSTPYPEGMQQAMFGMGCFWGAERRYWQLEGVFITAVGYSAGYTPNPSYEEVCTGLTGHNEVVFMVFDPSIVSYKRLLKEFWESHDPTQGMRQGNDIGTQYRSGIYTYSEEQQQLAMDSKQQFQKLLTEAGKGEITSEIKSAGAFYFAEGYHQQYLAKKPNGYCGLGGLGISL